MAATGKNCSTYIESTQALMELSYLCTFPMAAKAAILLKVPDILSTESIPLTAKQIPDRIPGDATSESKLDRLLQALATYGLFAVSDSNPRAYGLTAMSRLLVKDDNGLSLSPLFLYNTTSHLEALQHLHETVLVPFEKASGQPLFHFFAQNNEMGEIFHSTLSNLSALLMTSVLKNYDGFKDVKVLVDVGGGSGVICKMIKAAYPHISAINFDMPFVVAKAPKMPGIEHHGGSMFEYVPSGGDGWKRKRSYEYNNCVRKLQRREIGSIGNKAFSSTNSQERFRNFQLQEEFDTYDPKANWFLRLQFLKKRSKIIEIVAARDIIFALAQSGVCAAFSRETNKKVCFLNISPDEVIRSLFYNKNNDSLITVSVYASDNYSSLKCRTTPIEYIRRGQPDGGFALFESESLRWPGFVEFDDVNGKVLTFSAQDGVYKVFDLKNYTLLYSISDKNVEEIKISPGIMLLIFKKSSSGSHVPLKILNIEDGTVLKSFNHLLHRNKKVDFIEQFNEKLLVKQENENLQILDVRNTLLTEVSRTEFMTPSAFIFLYENQLFLTFRNRTVAVWNFRGELVTSFEDHLLWHPDCNTNNIYITSDQDLIISYCKAHPQGCDEKNAGSINISNILTGKCLAKIRANDPNVCISSRNRPNVSVIQSTVQEALEDITALFYDEERNEIYTGNRQGLIHVWSN